MDLSWWWETELCGKHFKICLHSPCTVFQEPAMHPDFLFIQHSKKLRTVSDQTWKPRTLVPDHSPRVGKAEWLWLRSLWRRLRVAITAFLVCISHSNCSRQNGKSKEPNFLSKWNCRFWRAEYVPSVTSTFAMKIDQNHLLSTAVLSRYPLSCVLIQINISFLQELWSLEQMSMSERADGARSTLRVNFTYFPHTVQSIPSLTFIKNTPK